MMEMLKSLVSIQNQLDQRFLGLVVPEERARPTLAENIKMESKPMGVCQPLVVCG